MAAELFSHRAPDKDELSPGRVVGQYTLVALIGAGGMGEVWAARVDGPGRFSRIVALKIIRGDFALQPNYVAMFLDEASVAAAVHHPNVCEVFELKNEGPLLYFVMEWIRGEPLSALFGAVPDRRLPPRIAARIVSDACSGIHSIHQAVDDRGAPLHVIHRDVSPQNVLVTAEGYVKVADLGIARAANQLHERTATGKIKGKIAYVSPEQARSKPYDHRVDIFSLGALLYEATVGERPFGDNGFETMRRIAMGEYSKPSTVVPDYPKDLEQIVEKALAVRPSDRYESAAEMHLALEAWLDRAGQVANPAVGELVARVLGERIESRARAVRLAAATLGPSGARERHGGPLVEGLMSAIEQAEIETSPVPYIPSAPEAADSGERASAETAAAPLSASTRGVASSGARERVALPSSSTPASSTPASTPASNASPVIATRWGVVLLAALALIASALAFWTTSR